MSNLDKLFKKFHDEVSLSSTQEDNLRRGRDALREEIRKWFADQEMPQPNFCWQGSFSMKTTVNPIRGDEYDLDDGVYLNGYEDTEVEDFPLVCDVHQWLVDAVTGHTKADPIDKNSCVRVTYAAGYHIDYPSYIIHDNKAYLSHKKLGWIVSDPKAMRNWFIKRVQLHGEQLRRIVKYLKAWKDYQELPLQGIEVTILAADHCVTCDSRDDLALYQTVTSILSALQCQFSCVKPVDPGEDLFADANDEKKRNVLNGLSNLQSALKKAIDEENEEYASEYMIAAFGDRFPKGKSSNGMKESVSAFGVLSHNGRSA